MSLVFRTLLFFTRRGVTGSTQFNTVKHSPWTRKNFTAELRLYSPLHSDGAINQYTQYKKGNISGLLDLWVLRKWREIKNRN